MVGVGPDLPADPLVVDGLPEPTDDWFVGASLTEISRVTGADLASDFSTDFSIALVATMGLLEIAPGILVSRRVDSSP